MDANQRSETNNQTNNGANEKWTPGSKGNTTSGPNDHTYPNGDTMQQVQPGSGPVGTQQADLNAGASEQNWFNRDDSKFPATGGDLHGGSMQSQQTGGSGPQQGITDSHQRQMEMHSEAWGLLEQPVGRRDKHGGVDVHPHTGNSQAVHDMNPQNINQPELQGGSLGHHHHHYDAPQVVGESPLRSAQADLSATPHEELYGRDQVHAPRNAMQAGPRNMQSGGGEQQSRQSQQGGGMQSGGAQSGSMQSGSRQSGSAASGSAPSGSAPSGSASSRGVQPGSMQSGSVQSGNTQSGSGQSDQREYANEQRSGGHSQYSADRDGSQTGEQARDKGTEDVHLSNDVAGGLPRSPGNSGPRSDNPGWKPGGSMQRDPAVHESNDTIGGLPRSPAGANQLAGDRKMDDDTGFSRK
ncbi:hypothetical protein [Massilia sp. AB1]|uniref:hypothetical protein n=1 Tax=Massilia sp. AB1 TaxID=2823371 RepID=UPI001B827315|nr:hypothetical protein [Massilia sp. AB1]MBQ5939212.1 hypothetical protein [Massilia sp. AB1]